MDQVRSTSLSSKLRKDGGMQSKLPIGSRIVWDGPWPVDDAVPLRLPGIILGVLPDGWFTVRWVDKTGWYDAQAVYELNHLRHASDDEFDRLVGEVRASGWQGFPPHPAPRQEPSEFEVGQRVRWTGPLPGGAGWVEEESEWRSLALGGKPFSSLVGTIEEIALNAAVRVRWHREEGVFVGRDFIRPDWVRASS